MMKKTTIIAIISFIVLMVVLFSKIYVKGKKQVGRVTTFDPGTVLADDEHEESIVRYSLDDILKLSEQQ